MRLIDADFLEKEGWSLHRTYQKDKVTMVYEVKAISEINTAQPEWKTELESAETQIEILSVLRAQFNCFDEAEEPVYRALSDAIYALSAQPEVTEEAVKEYCRKRCLCIVDSALLKKYASAQPEWEELLVICDNCGHAIHVKRQ